MIKGKHILIGGGIAFAIASLWGGRRALQITAVAKQLRVQLRGISSFPELFGSRIKSSVNIAIINPTDTPFNLQSGGMVKLKQIHIYNKQNQLAAVASPNIGGIEIPAFSEIVLKKIPVESNIQGLLNTILLGGTRAEDYRIESQIEIVGQTFNI
ncbi:MAG: hypothetical protein AAF634_13170 [Bacteroidota bacterium]